MQLTREHIELAYANGIRNFRNLSLRQLDLSELDLSDCDFSQSDLYNTSFIGSKLDYVYFNFADLAYTKFTNAKYSKLFIHDARFNRTVGIKYATCSFDSYGECGRQLTAIKINGEVTLSCGCFTGSPEDLKTYIKNGYKGIYESRMLAFNFVMAAIDMERP